MTFYLWDGSREIDGDDNVAMRTALLNPYTKETTGATLTGSQGSKVLTLDNTEELAAVQVYVDGLLVLPSDYTHNEAETNATITFSINIYDDQSIFVTGINSTSGA